MALSDPALEAEAQRQLYSELNFNLIPTILSDSKGELNVSENPTNYQRIKHINIRYHYIRHQLEFSRLTIDFIPSEQNAADALTKPLRKTSIAIAYHV